MLALLAFFTFPALAQPSCLWSELEAIVRANDPARLNSLAEACPNLVTAKDFSGETLLFTAARKGAVHSASWLIAAGTNVNTVASNGCTALCYAPSAAMARLLVENGTVIQRADLEWAGNFYHGDVLEYLAEQVPAPVVRGEGRFLRYLSYYDDRDLRSTRLLVEKGADLNQAIPHGINDRRSPLAFYVEHYVEDHIDYSTHGFKAIRFLLEQGADPHALFPQKGNPVLHYALDAKISEPARALDLLDLFLAHGLKREHLDDDGQTLLMQMASARTDTPEQAAYVALVLEALLNRGFSPNTQGFEGRTALHWAIRWCNEATALALASVTDKRLRDDRGRTPADFARMQLELHATSPATVAALKRILQALE